MVFVPMLASAERGENELRISNIQTEAGQQVKLTVELVNENTISGIGAYLTLPEGITMEDISIVPGRWNDVFTQAFAKTKDGRYKFAVITWEKNDYIQAGEGNIFTITLNVGKDALEFVSQIKALGYKVFAQLVSITSYEDDELLDLIRLANDVEPYAVSMVDTYGLCHSDTLMHYCEILDKNLKPEISPSRAKRRWWRNK